MQWRSEQGSTSQSNLTIDHFDMHLPTSMCHFGHHRWNVWCPLANDKHAIAVATSHLKRSETF